MKIKPLVLLVGLSLWCGQRVGASDDIPTVPEAAAVASVTADGATRFYGTIEDAFAVATNDFATIRLLKDTMLTDNVSVKAALTFDGNGKTLTREETALIAVTNQSLVVRNVVMSGGATRFLDVYGQQGALTLDAGATIRDITGTGREMVAAVAVWGGSFTMNSGARIQNCVNLYARTDGDALAAGGVVVSSFDELDAAVAYLNGGTVTGCCGSSAGGIYVGNKAKVQVKGDLEVKGNVSLAGEPLNLVVHDLSSLQLVGEVTKGAGSIGYTEGIRGDPEQLGFVVSTALTDEQMVASARSFFHDSNGDSGAIVKGNGKTLLVWHSAVSTAGVYTDEEGNSYTIETAGQTVMVDVPDPVLGLVYNGGEQTGVLPGLAYEIVSGDTGTNAGTYVATVRLRPGCVWLDGSTADKTIEWTIAKAVYNLSGIVFESARYSIAGPVSLPIALECQNVPDGVTVHYRDNNQQENNLLGKVGSLTVTASFTGDEINYEPIPETFTLTATLTIDDSETVETSDLPNPQAVQGLVYNGSEQMGVCPGIGYEIVSGNKAVTAGTYVATVRLVPGYESWADGSTAKEKEIEWEIAKADYDLSGVTFEDVRYPVTGPLPRTLKCTGKLPAGVTVSYTPNQLGKVGSLTVIASFTGDEINYNPIPDRTATLTIYDPAAPDDQPLPDPQAVPGLVYNGSVQMGVCPGVGYEIVSGNTGLTAGTYVATVRLVPGYESWADGSTAKEKEIEWTIAKAVYDMSGVIFEDVSYSADGPLPRTLKCAGKLPAGVTVVYTDNQLGEVGSLTATASFTGDEINYEPIPDRTATLTIYDPKLVEPDQPEPPTPPEPEPVVCQPFKFTAIDKQADGSWKMTLAPGTPYCVYTLYTSDDLSTWTPVGEPLVLAPGAALEFSGVGGELQRFWIVTGADGEKPAED